MMLGGGRFCLLLVAGVLVVGAGGCVGACVVGGVVVAVVMG